MSWTHGLSINRRHFLEGMASVTAGLILPGRQARAADSKLLVHTTTPMNAEPPLERLIGSWLTPTDLFYVRSHAPVPEISADSFRLSVEGLVDRPLQLTLGELQSRFEQRSVVATMTCAGNRRTEHMRVKPIKGVPWQEGAVGNARWSGALLSSVLKLAGVKPEARHVWFEGLDQIERSSGVIPFGASIPIEKALADTESMPGALLATQMNGEALTGDHGWPLRTVVPGYIGARSVKWLGKIVVSNRPSENHYVATAYKLVEDGDPLEWAEAGPLYRIPLNSAICRYDRGERATAGQVEVAGYAYPSGRPGTHIARVEVSADGGRSWTEAKISSPVREFCWVLWSAQIAVPRTANELIVRATDSKGMQQPEQVRWNAKGYMFNAWHRVPLNGG